MSQTPFNPGKFEKVEQVDLVPAMQENYDRINEDLRVAYEGMRENDRRKIEAAKRQGDALVSLAQFSQSLTDFLVERQKEKNEEDELAGLELAYAEGLDPLTMQKFDEDEAEVERVDGEIRRTAGAVEAEGNAFAGQRIRELSGHKALGYAKGVAANAAVNYPIWFAQEAETATIMVGNKEVTLATANSVEERMAVMAAIRRKYLVQFNNVNPALLNKYLFEPMRRFEETENKAWGQQFAVRLQKERQAEAEDDLYANIKSGKNVGEIALGFIERYQGDYGSRGDARNKFFDLLGELHKNGHVDDTIVDQLAEYEFYHDGLKKTVAFGDPKAFGRQIEQLRRQFQDDRAAEIQRREDLESAQRTQLQNEWEAVVAEANSRGELVSDAVRDDFKNRFISGGLGTSEPTWLSDYKTREDYDEDQEVERMQAIARANGGYLVRSHVKDLSPGAYERVKNLIANNPAKLAGLNTLAEKSLTHTIKEKGYFDEGTKDLTGVGEETLYEAKEDYQSIRQDLLEDGVDEKEAHRFALEAVKKKIMSGELGREVRRKADYNKTQSDFVAASRERNARGEAITGGLNNKSIDDVLAETLEYGRGRGSIPRIFELMARDGEKPAHEIAEENYRMLTGQELFSRDVLEGSQPTTRQLLSGIPSSSKSLRILTSDMQWGLDAIASKESEAYGGYTAFNQGGSNNGYTAFQSGDSAKGDFGHDRPITELTIAEIIERQRRPKGAPGALFAAGRYQFIPTTLLETFPLTGLSMDDKFDAAAQDRFAIARARWRLNLDNSNQGLINEWRGLKFLPAADLSRLRTILNTIPQSPYNLPENLRPGVAQALLR